MADATATPRTIQALLPDSFILAYTVPLLLGSVLATFAGAFLTLDRTRSFAPIDRPIPHLTPRSRRDGFWILEGGVGGLVAGWLGGLHAATYFSLLVINRSTKFHLSGIQFLVIWLLSGALLTVIGGRWRIAASVFYSIVGGAGLTALLTIIFLPKTLLARFIMFIVFTVPLLIGTILPFPLVRHWCLRTGSSLAGATGTVMVIALFTHIESWSNPWLVLATHRVVGDRNAKEKGLSTALCLLALIGGAMDWFLMTKFGENPDKAWDAYLATYSREVPLDGDREGIFQPAPSPWKRLFGGGNSPKKASADILFPPDSQLLPTASSVTRPFAASPPPAFRPYPNARKSSATLSKNKRTSFSPKVVGHDDDSTSESSDSDVQRDPSAPPKFRPWLKQRQASANSAATTAVGADPFANPSPKTKKPLAKVEEYSDVEEADVAGVVASATGDRDSPGWKPGFIKKHEEEKRRSFGPSSTRERDDKKDDVPPRLTSSPTPVSRHNTSSTNSQNPFTGSSTASGLTSRRDGVPLGAVPATPSLIHAYNRITRAQQEAYSSAGEDAPTSQNTKNTAAVASPHRPLESTPKPKLTTVDEGFWKKVQTKAATYAPEVGVVR